MSPSTSVYAVTQADPPKWKPQELQAASAFIGIAIWLLVDIQFGIVRVFKSKRGLYFWSLQVGMLGLFLDAIGVILKYLTPGTKHVWGLYTFLLLGGWAVYAPAQLMVLYSRLHLVNDIPWLRKLVLGAILSTYLLFILPTWVCNWQSYNPDPKKTSLWSPRTAIVERYTQFGFTGVECFVSGVYIWSLLNLLQGKMTIRQRRIMWDLIYVNVLTVLFDIMTLIFIYLNQLGISHPIQTLSYALKFKLEFLVLNQLMAVAARGIRKKSWAEKRYHHPDVQDTFSAEAHRWAANTSPPLPAAQNDQDEDPFGNPPDYDSRTGPQSLAVPARVASRPDHENSVIEQDPSLPNPDPSNQSEFSFNATPAPDLRYPSIDEGPEQPSRTASLPSHQPSLAFSGDTLHPGPHEPREESPHLFRRLRPKRKRRTMEIIREHIGGHGHQDRDRPRDLEREGEEKPRMSRQTSHLDFNPNMPINATIRRPNPRKKSRDDDEDEEEEFGVHMWERRGTILLCAPWMEKEESMREMQRQDV